MKTKLIAETPAKSRFSLQVLTMITFVTSLALSQGASHLPGNWSGSFSSHNFASFPMTVSITQDASGRLLGKANMVHPCVQKSTLIVTQVGSNVVFGGSDAEGDTITLRGTIDPDGTLLDMSFVLNGSPSGRCETDQGKGSLGKTN